MFFSSSTPKHEKGHGLVEYVILLALVAVLAIGTITILGNKSCNTFSYIHNSLPNSGTPSNTDCKAAVANLTTYNSEHAAIAAVCAGKPKKTNYFLYSMEINVNKTYLSSLTSLNPTPSGYKAEGMDQCD